MSQIEYEAQPVWMGRTNHRWLSQMLVAAWLLPSAALLDLGMELAQVTGRWLPYKWAWLVLFDWTWNLGVYLVALQVAAIWMLTSPQRDGSTARVRSRPWARWLGVGVFLFSDALACLPLGVDVDMWQQQILKAVGTIANVCLMFMMRQYAMQSHDDFGAKLMRGAAMLGIATAIANLLGAVLWLAGGASGWAMPLTWAVLLVPLAVYLAFVVSLEWAAIRFAMRFQRTLRAVRPVVRVRPVIVAVIAAIVLGGIGGFATQQLLQVQALRAGEGLSPCLMELSQRSPHVGVFVGAAVLPLSLQKLYRIYRHRR